MTRDAFPRLLYVSGWTGYVVALGVVAELLGWPLAAAAAVGGPLLALAYSHEPEPPASDPEPAGRGEREGLSRREILRRAGE